MDRVLAAGVVPVLLSAVLLPCALSSSLYNVSLGNREGSNGNTVTATCMGVFSDPSRLTWYYNGSDGHRCLCEATRTNLSIVIRLVPDCEGYLQCGTSETLSRSVPLYAYPDFTSLQLMSTIYARESSSVTLACNLGVSALFNYNVSWLFRPAQSMFPTATTSATNPNYSLTLHNVSLSDSGVYQCQVTAIAFPDNVYLPSSQQHESRLGATVNLTVEQYDPPRFTSSLAYSPVNVTEALFTVSATGTLPLSYSWYLNDTRLSLGSGLVRVLQGGTLVLVTFPSDGTTVRVEVSNIDGTNGTVNSISQSAVLFVRVINTGLTDPYNLSSFVGYIVITIISCAFISLILVVLAVVCRVVVRWAKNSHREKQMNMYFAMQRSGTPSSVADSTSSTSQGTAAVVNILYAAGDLLLYNKELDLEIIEALYHFLPVVLDHSEHSEAYDTVQRVKRNLQLLQLSLTLPATSGGGGGTSGYDSDTAYSTTDDQVPLQMSQL